jgi:hypothetical protein
MYESRTDDDRDNTHFFRYQIVRAAKSLGHFADLRRYRAWVALVIETEMRTEILFSFHGIGHVDSGVLGCPAIAYLKEKASFTGDQG